MGLDGVRFKYFMRIVGVISSVFLLTRIGHASTSHKPQAHTVHEASAKSRASDHHRSPVRHVAAHHAVTHGKTQHRVAHVRRVSTHHITHHARRRYHHLHHLVRRVGYRWCVPYARRVSHIDLKGDAFLWWAKAAGRYARGHRPELGAVLNFRPTHRMPLGHVAVVSKVINSREVLVDQANWIPDTITRNVAVIDVSATNDWSEVRVALGNGKFGMDYPTYGFIYRQAPSNVVYANSGGTEVAEAPVVHKIRFSAPNRTLR